MMLRQATSEPDTNERSTQNETKGNQCDLRWIFNQEAVPLPRTQFELLKHGELSNPLTPK
jgi:hypothetical protein